MYYEDENNLYHYSYRKGDKVENVRDVDYTEVPNTVNARNSGPKIATTSAITP